MVFYRMQGNEFKFQLLNNKVVERIGEKYGKKQFIRDIAVNEQGNNIHYSYSFSGGSNEQLVIAFGNCAMQGGSPLEYEFTLRKYLLPELNNEGKKLEEWQRVRYNVVAGSRVGLPQNVIEPSVTPKETPISVEQANKQYDVVDLQKVPIFASNAVAQPSQGGFEIPKPQAEVPDNEEMQIIQWANSYQDKLTEQQFIDGFNHSLKKNFNKIITDERARRWFYQYYQKK